MRIGIVCYPTLGGSGVVATELGHELALRGHQVHFITYEIPFRLRLEDKNIFFHQVEINQYELFKYPDYALTLAVKIANISQQFDLDILHVHYAIPHASSAYLAKQILGTKRPAVITTLHGTDITLVGIDPAYYQIVKFSIEKSCGVTAVSESLRHQIYEYFHIEKDIEMIHNFFTAKPGLAKEKPMRHLFVRDHEKLIIHSSNFRPVKRVEDVIEIFFNVQKRLKAKLLLLGSGKGLEDARAKVKELGLQNSVYFVGKSRDVDPYIASGDLFLLPSSQESFGLAALEALAYGVPVIATAIGGLPELIDHGRTGYLADVGDVKLMSDYALKMLQDPAVYAEMSAEAKKQACERFCVTKIIPQYEAYYAKVLAESDKGT